VLILSSGSGRLSGSEFQVDGPATAKRRRPKPFNFRWVADHRRWQPVTSAVSVQLSIKYGGAVPWRHWYMSTASLNCTPSVSSCGSRDKPRELLTTRSAEFITLYIGYNLSVMTLSDSTSIIVDARCHKWFNDNCSWPGIERLPDTANLSEMKKADSA